jgi:isoquinoline 1-oxidoreductase subunit beta
MWMSIASDGTVTIVAHRSEMGCGSRTALPMVVADELDADWTQVRIEQAIGDPRYGDQDTDGSHSVRSNFELMRQVGATGRAMLISAAATQWKVPAKECSTEPHFVVHKASGRKLAMANWRPRRRNCRFQRKKICALNEIRVALYRQGDNSLFDLPEIVTGIAVFGMDAAMPGWSMRRSSIRRCLDRRSSPTTTRLRSKCRECTEDSDY